MVAFWVMRVWVPSWKLARLLTLSIQETASLFPVSPVVAHVHTVNSACLRTACMMRAHQAWGGSSGTSSMGPRLSTCASHLQRTPCTSCLKESATKPDWYYLTSCQQVSKLVCATAGSNPATSLQ